jgi:hypothetical protein
MSSSGMVRGAHRSVWVLRGVLLAGAVLALFAGVPEGYDPPVALVVFVVVGATLSAFRPEHLSLAITMVAVVVWWAYAHDTEMPVAVLVAAAGLLATHVAGVVLAYGPPSLPVAPEVALLWSGRGILAWVAALVVSGVARSYTGHGTPAVFWLTGLAAALVGAVVAGAAVPMRGQGTRG